MRVHFHLLIIILFTTLFSCKDDEYNNLVDTNIILSAPTELSVTFSADTMVTLSWQHSLSNDLEFIAEVSENNSSWTELGRVERNNSLQARYNFINGKSYSFRVRAAKDENQSLVTVSLQASIILNEPSALLVNFPSDTLAVLSWTDNSTFEAGFEIEMSTDETNYSLIKSVGENVNTSEIKGEYLVDESYSFRVRAKTSINYSNYSEVSQSSPSRLSPPNNLTIIFPDDTHAELNWNDNTIGESGYEIDIKINDGEYVKVYDAGPNATSCIITGQYSTSSIYSFRIRSKTSVNYSSYSNSAEGAPVLQAPTNLKAVFEKDTKAILSWKDNSGYENGFEIERNINNGNYTKVLEVGSDVNSCEIEGQYSIALIYSFRIRSKTSVNFSSYSNSTEGAPVLQAPTNLQVVIENNTTATLTWSDNSSYEKDFVIEISENNLDYIVKKSVPENSTLTEINHIFNYNKTYRFRIRAITDYNQSSYSNVVSDGLRPAKPEPSTPENNSVIQTELPSLNWKSANGADAYTLQVSTSDLFSNLAYERTDLRNTSQQINGLSTLTEYYWRVRAVNEFGISEWSDVRSFIIPATFVLQPDAETGKDAHFSFATPNDNKGLVPFIAPYAWTQGGSINISRDLLQFDISELGNNPIIESAFLYLYFNPIENMNLLQHAGDYSMILQRVIQPWDELGVTWNNQPAVDQLHSVNIAKSTSSHDNYIIDITQLLKDIVESKMNYGFLLRLENEQPYSVALFASSDNPVGNLRPKLVVKYIK